MSGILVLGGVALGVLGTLSIQALRRYPSELTVRVYDNFLLVDVGLKWKSSDTYEEFLRAFQVSLPTKNSSSLVYTYHQGNFHYDMACLTPETYPIFNEYALKGKVGKMYVE